MRYNRKSLLLLFMILFVLFKDVIVVDAVNTRFQTNQLPIEQKETIVKNINVYLMEKEPDKKPVVCFDVNYNGLIAIGQKSSGVAMICIYSNEGVFKYGYTFSCLGDFGVEWDADNLNIYFVRSNTIVSVTPKGEIEDVVEISNTIENNSYVNNYIYSTQRTIGDIDYSIRNDMGILNLFASSYSQVIVQDGVGVERVIYDVSSTQRSNMTATVIIVCIFVFVSVAVIVRLFIRKNQDKTGGRQGYKTNQS